MYQWHSSPERRLAAADASRGNIPNPNTPTIWSAKRERPIAKPYSGLTAPVSHAAMRRCRAQGRTRCPRKELRSSVNASRAEASRAKPVDPPVPAPVSTGALAGLALLWLSRWRGCRGLVCVSRRTSLMARAAPMLAALLSGGPSGRGFGGGGGPSGGRFGCLGLGFLGSNKRRRQ
jgi:hypothetical protein